MYDNLLPNEPILMPFQAQPFNGDTFACQEFLKLKEKFGIATTIELGSCVFGTTKWLSENFEKVITVEINDEFRNIGLKRVSGLKNITSILGNSIDKLPQILKECDDKMIIFLDSHWYNFPLIEELKIIFDSGKKPCLVVHDCLVPDEPTMGFDQWEGVTISHKTMQPYLEKIFTNGYDYHYNSAATSTQVKRGIIYIYPK
jgi:hypothetical protein